MAKKAKYTDDQLLEAVVRYAEIYAGKIKPEQLARWANKNIVGLEEVRGYHFTRPTIQTDPKSKRKKNISKPCNIKIKEINDERSLVKLTAKNMVLSSANIDPFFNQPALIQREQIIDARELVHKTIKENAQLRKENDFLKKENREQSKICEETRNYLKKVENKLLKFQRSANIIIRAINDLRMREKLAEMGIKDSILEITTYFESLPLTTSQIIDFDYELQKYLSEASTDSDISSEIIEFYSTKEEPENNDSKNNNVELKKQSNTSQGNIKNDLLDLNF